MSLTEGYFASQFRVEMVRQCLRKVSGLKDSHRGNLTDEEWDEKKRRRGLRVFKARTLGLCPFKRVYKEEDFFAKLIEIGMVDSDEAARNLASCLDGYRSDYYGQFFSLGVDKVNNGKDERGYRIGF